MLAINRVKQSQRGAKSLWHGLRETADYTVLSFRALAGRLSVGKY